MSRGGITGTCRKPHCYGAIHGWGSFIDYEPYQFRPVLKMVHADRPRILVADDVGVGKTIEACLIIKELQARQRAQRVLIVCPKPLVVDDKWRSELKRFGEDFVHLDGPTLRFCIEETQREGAWPARYSHAIVPYSLLDERLLHGSDRSGGVRRTSPTRRPGAGDEPQDAQVRGARSAGWGRNLRRFGVRGRVGARRRGWRGRRQGRGRTR